MNGERGRQRKYVIAMANYDCEHHHGLKYVSETEHAKTTLNQLNFCLTLIGTVFGIPNI